MEDLRRGEHYLALPNPGGYITVYPPKMVARLEEKVAEASFSDVRAQALLMELFQGSFLWVRQAGSNQFERQTARACGYQRQGCVGWEFLGFCDLVGRSLREPGICRSKEYI